MTITWHYHCSKCGAMLNPGGIVTLIAIRGELRVLVGFHPEPGNYELYTPPRVSFAHGNVYDFHCPVCRADLRSSRHANLCELVQYENGVRKTLLFSRVAGERATYVIGDDDHPKRLGEHSSRYDDDTIDITT